MRVVALAGGVGGAKLAQGLAEELPDKRVTIVVNTGDDELFHGLHVSPDLDTVMYTLAGIANSETGWGLEGETFHFLDSIERYGVPTWFKLGDRDLATHVRRTELLSEGYSLSYITEELCRRLGISADVVPMSDDSVRTVIQSVEGDLPFQEYFVRRRCEPALVDVSFVGAESATMAPKFSAALISADALIFCPSNPIVSIGPILAIPGVEEAIRAFRGPKIAVSPIIDSQAIKGPAAKMMGELGLDVSSVGIARHYSGLSDVMVIDELDKGKATEISQLGMSVEIRNTIMDSSESKRVFAKEIIKMAKDYGNRD